MILRPLISTRTETPLPYTTLFRSQRDLVGDRRGRADRKRRRRIGHVQMAGTDRRRACKHQHLRGLRRHRTDARHVQEEREEGLTRPWLAVAFWGNRSCTKPFPPRPAGPPSPLWSRASASFWP